MKSLEIILMESELCLDVEILTTLSSLRYPGEKLNTIHDKIHFQHLET